jgi:four helix bundle protein
LLDPSVHGSQTCRRPGGVPLAQAFKLEVYRLVEAHPAAKNDFKYRGQLFDAASGGEGNVDEGFQRYRAGEMRLFLSYARASISEAKRRVVDGVHRGYFPADACEPALTVGRRAGAAIAGLQRSLLPFVGRKGRRKKGKDGKTPP